MIKLTPPLSEEEVRGLKVGVEVLISGTIYTARDAAHKRLVELLDKDELPFDLSGQIIYYVGPTPERPGNPIGSSGPTTAYRMDPYAPRLIEKGLRGMIGKGERGQGVVDAMKNYGAVYFATTGGAAALIAEKIVYSKIVDYEDLGAEAIRELVVENFPAVVAQDSSGNNIYEMGKKEYQIV